MKKNFQAVHFLVLLTELFSVTTLAQAVQPAPPEFTVSQRLQTAQTEPSRVTEPTEIAAFEQLIDNYFTAWSDAVSNSAIDRPARFYAKDDGLVFYDPLPPLEGYHNWEQFKVDVVRNWREAGVVTADIQRTGTPQIWRRGDLAWAAVPHRATTTLRNGRSQSTEQRQTFVWQQRNRQWQIVHEHASATVKLGSSLPSQSGKTPLGQNNAELRQRVRDFWSAWNTKTVDAVAPFYSQTPDLFVYLPWRTGGFTGWNTYKQSANQIMQNMRTVRFTPYDDIYVLQVGDIAVTAGPFNLLMRDQMRTTTQGDARYTLIWERQDGQWRIVHEHLSSVISS